MFLRSHIVIAAGLLLVCASLGISEYRRQQYENLIQSVHLQEVHASHAASPPAAIDIPSVHLNVPLAAGYIIDGIWTVSKTHALHLSNSAYPGHPGNIIVYGHNSRDIFGRLSQVQIGDEIILSAADQERYAYRITGIHTTTADDASSIAQTEEEVLTIYTCTGLFDSKRLIVRAERL